MSTNPALRSIRGAPDGGACVVGAPVPEVVKLCLVRDHVTRHQMPNSDMNGFANGLSIKASHFHRVDRFNDWGGRGYDDFVLEEVTKTAPSGDETT